MEHVTIRSTELGSRCWLAKRFLGACDTCAFVKRCELPEGSAGRIKKYYTKLADLQRKADRIRALLAEELEKQS